MTPTPSATSSVSSTKVEATPAAGVVEPQETAEAIHRAVSSVVAVDPVLLDTLLVAMFAGGHALIEGIPGIGKTLLARTMAQCLDCTFRRVQFTNDLMPSDIVGTAVWRQSEERFTFNKGPLFSNVVLADEINRTSPRTLSCLLEAMENGMVSVEGRTVQLAEPFLVWATRNPIEFHGTYPIPEAALDRFLVRVELSDPDRDAEMALYQGRSPEEALAALQPVVERSQLVQMMQQAREVRIAEPVAAYCHRVVTATREHDAIALGASPRAALAWLAAAKARAFLDGRGSVLPDDLIALARPVLGHRLFLGGSGDSEELVERIVGETPVDL